MMYTSQLLNTLTFSHDEHIIFNTTQYFQKCNSHKYIQTMKSTLRHVLVNLKAYLPHFAPQCNPHTNMLTSKLLEYDSYDTQPSSNIKPLQISSQFAMTFFKIWPSEV